MDLSEKPPPPPSLGTWPQTQTYADVLSSPRRLRNWTVPQRVNPMLEHQGTIPKLPVPPLEQTCLMYLQSVQPLVTPEEWEQTQRSVLEFLTSGVGKKLQHRLEQRAAAKKDSSWLIEWWNVIAYFGFRESVVVNVSYFYQFRRDTWCGMSQLRRATGLIKATLAHRALVISEQLPPELVSFSGKAVPADMSMYTFLYSSCRVAHPGQDYYATYEPALCDHVLVLRRGRLFTINTRLGCGDRELTAAEIERLLVAVVALAEVPADCGSAPGIGAGVLTSDHRDRWAAERTHLLSLGRNAEALAMIQSAAFVVCLDDEAPSSPEAQARAFWHSATGGNRWFDKPLQFVVAENGESGFIGEHGMMDGQPTSLLCDWVLGRLSSGSKEVEMDFSGAACAAAAANATLEGPTEVRLELDERLRTAVCAAKGRFDALVAREDCHVLEFDAFGKEEIKRKAKISPDAFCQMAIQLAYFRWSKGRRGATYEACSVRRFLHGRTETIRSCHAPGADVVDAMASLTPSPEEDAAAYALLKKAAAHQSWYSAQAANAMGCDRHLLGLKLLLEPGEEMPSIFSDPIHARSAHWTLSTSTVASEHIAIAGFGEVVPDGFGVGYMCHEHSFSATISSQRLGAADFSEHLEKSLLDMRDLAERVHSPTNPRAKL